MAVPRFSFTNHLAGSGVVVTKSSEDPNFVATYALAPQRPFLPWRTLVTTASWITFDLLSAKLLQIVALIRTNFTSVTVQAHASDLGAGDWTTATYNSGALTIGQNKLTGRYQLAHIPGSAPTLRYLHLYIPAQTPTDGAAYFLLGGVWAGALTDAPRAFQVGAAWDPDEPAELIKPDHGGWEQKLVLGNPRARWKVKRPAGVLPASPGVGDQLATWLSLDRSMRANDPYLIYPNVGDLGDVMVCRHEGRLAWTLNRGRADGDLQLVEVVGP